MFADLNILGGLFQSTLFSQSPLNLIGSLLFIDEFNILYSFIPSFQDYLLATTIILYNNAETERLQILSDNKRKTGIYMWIHKESGKTYIGSALELSKRLRSYYSIT